MVTKDAFVKTACRFVVRMPTRCEVRGGDVLVRLSERHVARDRHPMHHTMAGVIVDRPMLLTPFGEHLTVAGREIGARSALPRFPTRASAHPSSIQRRPSALQGCPRRPNVDGP